MISEAKEIEKARNVVDSSAIPTIKNLFCDFDVRDIGQGLDGKANLEFDGTLKSKHILYGLDVLDDPANSLTANILIFGELVFCAKIIDVYLSSSGFERVVERNYSEPKRALRRADAQKTTEVLN